MHKVSDQNPRVTHLVVMQRTKSISRINACLIIAAIALYLLTPFLSLNERALPTPVSINGNTFWPMKTYVAIYLGQSIYAFSGMCAMGGYDVIFIQCIMLMKYRFRTLIEMLKLLKSSDVDQRDDRKDKEILVDIYKMHLNVLE